MILSDKEIKGSNVPYTIFRNSHLEANAVIRELEAENYCLKMRLEDCKLEAEEVASYINETMNENNLIEAKLRELVEATKWRDECQEMAKCENSFFVFKTSCPTLEDWDRAVDADKSFFLIREAAEAAYQAALKAASGE
jgi:predicted nuclease with TOPRIM domain